MLPNSYNAQVSPSQQVTVMARLRKPDLVVLGGDVLRRNKSKIGSKYYLLRPTQVPLFLSSRYLGERSHCTTWFSLESCTGRCRPTPSTARSAVSWACVLSHAWFSVLASGVLVPEGPLTAQEGKHVRGTRVCKAQQECHQPVEWCRLTVLGSVHSDWHLFPLGWELVLHRKWGSVSLNVT